MQHLKERKLAPATIARRMRRIKAIFAHGVKRKLLASNPFGEVSTPNILPADKLAYVSQDDTRRLWEAADPGWRTLIALARYAGLRCPSEVLSLRWADIKLAEGFMTVRSPKTEHIPGKAWRVVPIFAQLRPILEEPYQSLRKPMSWPRWGRNTSYPARRLTGCGSGLRDHGDGTTPIPARSLSGSSCGSACPAGPG